MKFRTKLCHLGEVIQYLRRAVPGLDDIRLTTFAKRDLKAIGGRTEKNLIGELFRLGDADRRGKTTALDWQDNEAVGRKAWRIGNFTVVYHEQLDEAGRTIRVIEGVVLDKYLDDWLAARSAEAKQRDDRIAAEDERSSGG
jgi:hypothetical protein